MTYEAYCTFEEHRIRAVKVDNEYWFLCPDITLAVGIYDDMFNDWNNFFDNRFDIRIYKLNKKCVPRLKIVCDQYITDIDGVITYLTDYVPKTRRAKRLLSWFRDGLYEKENMIIGTLENVGQINQCIEQEIIKRPRWLTDEVLKKWLYGF